MKASDSVAASLDPRPPEDISEDACEVAESRAPESRVRPLASASGRSVHRTLQLVPPLPGPSPQDSPEQTIQPLAPEPAEAVRLKPVDQALAAANRLLEQELAETQEEVEALQELLEELPGIFERKFRQRLARVLQERRQLEASNRDLWTRLRALSPAGEPEITLQRPHGLLPPATGESLQPLHLHNSPQARLEPGPAGADSAMAS